VSVSEQNAKAKRLRLFGVLFLVLGLAVFVRWASSREFGVTWDEAPEETRGIWTSTDPRYTSRAIEVTASSVVLRVGDESQVVYGSLDIARERFDNDERVLRLEYTTDAGPDALDIVLSDGGSMHLANQPDVIWTLARDATYSPPSPTMATGDGGSTRGLPWTALGGGLLALFLLGGGIVMMRRAAAGALPEVSLPGTAPAAIQGVWVTQDPRAEGRTIRIAPGYGFAQFGPGDVRIGGEIESVRQWREDGVPVYGVQYRGPDGVTEIEMTIDKLGHMRLRDGSRSVWVKRQS